MDWAGPTFVIAIVAISTLGWVLTTAIRARHGYPVENEWSGQASRNDRGLELLSNENERLQASVLRLEERVAVLERLATDSGTRITRDIEALR